MSTSHQRAAAYIAVTLAEGHSITLIRAAFRDGKDGVFTAFDIAELVVIYQETAILAASYQHDSAEDRAALRAELINRGWV